MAEHSNTPVVTQLAKYTAITEKGARITSVYAATWPEAINGLEHQLDRPGRRDALKKWREGEYLVDVSFD